VVGRSCRQESLQAVTNRRVWPRRVFAENIGFARFVAGGFVENFKTRTTFLLHGSRAKATLRVSVESNASIV